MIGTLVDIGVSPIDEHNTKLLDNVHPANWVDAEPDGVRDSTMVATRGCVIGATVYSYLEIVHSICKLDAARDIFAPSPPDVV